MQKMKSRQKACAKAISVRGLSFSFGSNRALDNISFDINEGDFLGIIGPNGAGKTTLVRLLLGLLNPEDGEIEIFGKNIRNFDRWEKAGYVPQKFGVDKNFPATVEEILSLAGKGTDFEKVTSSLGISGILHSKFVELSGGQQQRVMTAMALLKDTRLLILDEPAVGVDLRGQKNFYNFLGEINRKGITVVFVEHDVGMVSKYAKSVLCLNRTVCCSGPSENIGEYMKEVYGEDFHLHRHH